MKALTEATLYRDAGNVKRYHTKCTLRQQTVAEHTFGVLMLVKQVAEYDSELYNCRFVEAVLHHDLPELMTGDIPAPIKRAHPQLGPLLDDIEEGLAPLCISVMLTSDQEALLKWADKMELVLWCLEELEMGNTQVRDMIRVTMGWILTTVVPTCARPLTDEVVSRMSYLGLKPATGNELEMSR